MRTTITLDSDVAALVERAMRERKQSFKTIVNDAIRTGLGTGGHVDIVFPTFEMGVPRFDLTHANQLAATLEDEEIIRELQVGR